MNRLAIALISGFILAAVPPLAAQTVLRTEFQDTQPKFIQNASGGFSGLCLEIMALLEQKSNLRFSYPATFVPIARITDDLAKGNIDIYFGLAKTPARESQFRYIGPLFDTRYQILTRKDDPLSTCGSVETLVATKVPLMVIKGSASALYFQRIPGLATFDAPTALDSSLRQLQSGRGRLFGYYDLGNNYMLDTLDLRNSLVALPIRFDLDTQWLCVKSSLPDDQVAAVRAAWETARQTAEWRAIMHRWFGN